MGGWAATAVGASIPGVGDKRPGGPQSGPSRRLGHRSPESFLCSVQTQPRLPWGPFRW